MQEINSQHFGHETFLALEVTGVSSVSEYRCISKLTQDGVAVHFCTHVDQMQAEEYVVCGAGSRAQHASSPRIIIGYRFTQEDLVVMLSHRIIE